MQNEIKNLKNKVLDELKKAKDLDVIKELETRIIGRKGELTGMLKSIKNLSDEQKKTLGKLANETKKEIKTKLEEAKALLSGQSGEDSVDITMPGKKIKSGHIHPISQIQYELEDLFTSMGFLVLDGPELESDYYNFEALNIPHHHPARDMQDTFYVTTSEPGEIKKSVRNTKSDLVMRTHTSPVQVRAMQKFGAPFRGVVPGRVFRNEELDDCHEHTFDQMEGLMIDENISLSNLIAVMKELINGIFKREVETRIRPGYFPFVEPGIELDIKCTICGGAGCSTCKHSGWLELLPAGMIHPNVLRYGGIDSEKYTGFAFGLGLTRMAMMKYGIEDIRMFNSGDLRFLKQF
jgi:phenylalanyl-tRNA synthetase alpha chain